MKEEGNKSTPLIIALAIIVAVIVVMLGVICVLLIGRGNGSKNNGSKNNGSKSHEKSEVSKDDDEDNEDDKKASKDDDEASNSDNNQEETQASTETFALEESVGEEQNLYVTVPAETLSLRMTAGFGEDVIAQLGPNTSVIYEGETQTINDTDFYKVTVSSTGQTGYVMADYCVRVRFKYSESDLGIVETNNALYTYDMMVKDMMTLSDKYPDIISYFELTKSLDGKPIYVMVFGNPNAKNHVMVQSTIHGREYMNTQLVMRMIEYYAVYYNTGTYDGVAYSDLFDNTNLYIVPMANPDGVSISQFGLDGVSSSEYKELIEECYERDKYYMVYKEDSEGDMYWDDRYKDESFDRSSQENTREITFDEYTREWKSNAQGVDLNRNFNAGWIDIDEKDYPSYGSFKGYQPVSEPETQGLVDLANQYDFSYYLSYHSKGNLIYYGCSENSQDTAIKVENLATLMENFIKFKKVDSSKSYNTTLGGFNDFVQLGLNKSGVTIESGKHRCPLDISEFTPMWLRHRESWAMLAKTLY